jgi:uncharacterized protein
VNNSTEILRQDFINAAATTHLGLIVSLTEQCNFRCTYCYESFALGPMSEEIFSGLKLFAAYKIPRLRSFTLNFFGGEPLLETARMLEFAHFCKDLCERHDVNTGVITISTNAWGLTPRLVPKLVAAKISRYMVSLDGLGEVHDATRKLISGKGTFDRLYANLRGIQSTAEPFSVILRLHLHAGNLASQKELVAKMAQDFGDDKRFYLHPTVVRNFGGDGVSALSLLKDEPSRALRYELQEQFRPGLSSEPVPFADHLRVCYASRPNHIFVRPDGRIQKCTTALESDYNTVGRLNLDGKLTVDTQKVLMWAHGFKSGAPSDLSCPNGVLRTVQRLPDQPAVSAT